MALTELVYVSAATQPFTRESLMALVAKVRSLNERNALTGVLLYDQGSFLQVLEGDDVALNETFARIEGDVRHKALQVLSRRPIIERTFDDWSMGLVWVDPSLTPALGFNSFLRNGYIGPKRGSALADRVLNAFREGRYRRNVA